MGKKNRKGRLIITRCLITGKKAVGRGTKVKMDAEKSFDYRRRSRRKTFREAHCARRRKGEDRIREKKGGSGAIFRT